MEIVFLAFLLLSMIGALASGFPVAFALPGSAILSIALAALCGALFAGDTSAYFAQDGPVQWLTAGITNFRGVYWDVDRDTLIAVPLFIFMGIMLQRSRIAEDLLVTMAKLFGPVPGGLGISVVFVGALLAATTGIVGATVVAMGLISLPAMLRNNYSRPLATGTICASGTLGQIIPPSIVLIILADQLASAADQAGTLRKEAYRFATGDANLPTEFGITSASAGDMFLGAFMPGLILVGLYMAYILVLALIRPRLAPPVPEEAKFDLRFAFGVVMALVPPLALIIIVLGSIIAGIATVNQAGAIGAVGATIMAGYRLTEGRKSTYYPAILALVSLALIFFLHARYDLNIRSATPANSMAITIAAVAVVALVGSVLWSLWRTFRLDDTLRYVCLETAKTSSMVFIILLGAAMLTAAFRGFGGEELVKNFLTSLPGGFWGQFIVVMAVIFLLGFFLDFIEIAVVVVPIMAPILLADPSANVTAVWLGVMVGVNMQTSFLTPPFGFSLFYLRGVAPPDVKTVHIYRGVIAFIVLQLVGLAIVGFNPALVNYLPNRTYLTSVTAPPPQNPRLQECLESYLAEYYDDNEPMLRERIANMRALDTTVLPEARRDELAEALDLAEATFERMDAITAARAALDEYAREYRPLHREVRSIQAAVRGVEERIADAGQRLNRERRAGAGDERLREIESEIETIESEAEALRQQVPAEWEGAREQFLDLAAAERTARLRYRRNVDDAYAPVQRLNRMLSQAGALAAVEEQLTALDQVLRDGGAAEAAERFQQAESLFSDFDEINHVRSALSSIRRAINDDGFDREHASAALGEALELYRREVDWRGRAASTLGEPLADYDDLLKESMGIRLQARMTEKQAKTVARCRSEHQDISLYF